jgi:hypothetical protein
MLAGVEPPDELRGDPRSVQRWNDLITFLSEPKTQGEINLLTLCCRWLSDDELTALVSIARRPIARYRALLQAIAAHIRAGRVEEGSDDVSYVVVSLSEPFARQILQFIPSEDHDE